MNSTQKPEDLEAELRPELDEALFGLDELAASNPEEALSMFETLPEAVQKMSEFQLTLARSHQTLNQLDVARDLTEGVLSREPENADGHHLLGDLLEDLGEKEKANEHFLLTLRIDRDTFNETSFFSESELIQRLSEVLDSTMDTLPNEVAVRVQAADRSVQLFPKDDQVRAGLDPRALSQWIGSEGSSGEALILFAANLDAEYGDLEEFNEFVPHVKEMIIREIIDHLELSGVESQRLGLTQQEEE